jgi:hypothetical protein
MLSPLGEEEAFVALKVAKKVTLSTLSLGAVQLSTQPGSPSKWLVVPPALFPVCTA